jgi:uncharacterized protein (DUF3820 family)
LHTPQHWIPKACILLQDSTERVTKMSDTMPFGKHKGEPIAELPHDYLAWLAGEDFINGRLRKTIAEEIRLRLRSVPMETPAVKRETVAA